MDPTGVSPEERRRREQQEEEIRGKLSPHEQALFDKAMQERQHREAHPPPQNPTPFEVAKKTTPLPLPRPAPSQTQKTQPPKREAAPERASEAKQAKQSAPGRPVTAREEKSGKADPDKEKVSAQTAQSQKEAALAKSGEQKRAAAPQASKAAASTEQKKATHPKEHAGEKLQKQHEVQNQEEARHAREQQKNSKQTGHQVLAAANAGAGAENKLEKKSADKELSKGEKKEKVVKKEEDEEEGLQTSENFERIKRREEQAGDSGIGMGLGSAPIVQVNPEAATPASTAAAQQAKIEKLAEIVSQYVAQIYAGKVGHETHVRMVLKAGAVPKEFAGAALNVVRKADGSHEVAFDGFAAPSDEAQALLLVQEKAGELRQRLAKKGIKVSSIKIGNTVVTISKE